MSGRKRNVKSAPLKSGFNSSEPRRNGRNTQVKREMPQTSETSKAMCLRKSPGKAKDKEKEDSGTEVHKLKNTQEKREIPQTSGPSGDVCLIKSPGKPEDKEKEDSDVEDDKLSILNSYNISTKELLKLLEEHQIKQRLKESQTLKTDGANTSAEGEKYGDCTAEVDLSTPAKTPVEQGIIQSPVLSDETIRQELPPGITAELNVVDSSETEIPSRKAEAGTYIHENMPGSQTSKTKVDLQKPQVPFPVSEKPHNSCTVDGGFPQKLLTSTPEVTIKSPTAKTDETFEKQLLADSGRSLKSPALEAELIPEKPLVRRQTPVKRRRSSKSPRGSDSKAYTQIPALNSDLIPEKPLATTVSKGNQVKRRRSSKSSGGCELSMNTEDSTTHSKPSTTHSPGRKSITTPIQKCKPVEDLTMTEEPGAKTLKTHTLSMPLLEASTIKSESSTKTMPLNQVKETGKMTQKSARHKHERKDSDAEQQNSDVQPHPKCVSPHSSLGGTMCFGTPEKKVKLSLLNVPDTDLGAVSDIPYISESCYSTCQSDCNTEEVMHSYDVISEDNSLKMKLKRKSISDMEKELKAKYSIKPSHVILIPLLPKEIEFWESKTDKAVLQNLPLESPLNKALESTESKESHSIIVKSGASSGNDVISKTLVKGSAEKTSPEAAVLKFTNNYTSGANSNRSPKPAPKCKKHHFENSPAPKCKKKPTSANQCKSNESGNVKKAEPSNKLKLKKDDGFAFVMPLSGGSKKTSKCVSMKSSSSLKMKKKDQRKSDHKTESSCKPTSSQKKSFPLCAPASHGMDPFARFIGQTTADDPLKKFQEDSELLDFEPGGDDDDLDCLSIMADPTILSGFASEWKPNNEDVIKPTVYAPIPAGDFVSSPPPSPVLSDRSVDDFEEESAEKCDTMNTKFQDPCEKNDNSEDIAPTGTSALGVPVESYPLEEVSTFESTSLFEKQAHDISKSPPPLCKSLIESHAVREGLEEFPCVKETLSDIIASELKMATESPMLVCDNFHKTVEDAVASPQAQPEVQGSEQNTIADTSVKQDDVSDDLEKIESDKHCENVIPSSNPTNSCAVETSATAEKHATCSEGPTQATQEQSVAEQDGGMPEIESHDLKEQLDQTSCTQKDSSTLPQSQQDGATRIPEDNLPLCSSEKKSMGEGSMELVTEKRPEEKSTNTSSEKCNNLEKKPKEKTSREIVTETRPKGKDEQSAKIASEKINRNLFPQNKAEPKEIGSERQSSLVSGGRRDRPFSEGRRKPSFHYGGPHFSQLGEPKRPLLPTPAGLPSQNVSVKTANVSVSIELNEGSQFSEPYYSGSQFLNRPLLNYGYHNPEPQNAPVVLPNMHTSAPRRMPASNSYSSSLRRNILPENQAQSQIMCAPQDQDYPCAQYSCGSFYGTGFQDPPAPSSLLGSYGTGLPIESSGLCIPSSVSEANYSAQKLDTHPSYLKTGPTRNRPCDTISQPSHERPRSYGNFSHVNVGRGDVDMRCRDVEPVQGDISATDSSDLGSDFLREYCSKYLESGSCNMAMNCGLRHEFPNMAFPIPWESVHVLKLLKASIRAYPFWIKNSLNDFIFYFRMQSDIKSLKDIAALFWQQNLRICNQKDQLKEYSKFWILLVEALCDCGITQNDAVKEAIVNGISQNFTDSVAEVLDHILDVLYPDFISKSTQTWEMVSCLTKIQVYEMPFKVLKVVLDSCVKENILIVNCEVAEYLLHKKYNFRYDNQEIEYVHQIHRLTKLLRDGKRNMLAKELEDLYIKKDHDNCSNHMPNMKKFVPSLRSSISSHKSNSQNFNLNSNYFRNRRTIGSASKGSESASGIEPRRTFGSASKGSESASGIQPRRTFGSASKGSESASGIEPNNDNFIKSPAKLAAPLMAETSSHALKPLNTESSDFDLPPQVNNPKGFNFKIVVNDSGRDVIAETLTVQHNENVDTHRSEVVKSPNMKSSCENHQLRPSTRQTLRNQDISTLILKKKFGVAASHIKKWSTNAEVDLGSSIVTDALFKSDNITEDFDILLKASGPSRKIMSVIGFQLMKRFADLNRWKEGFELLPLLEGNFHQISGTTISGQYLLFIKMSIKSHNFEKALQMLIEKRFPSKPADWLLDHGPEDICERDALCLELFDCLRLNTHLAIKTDTLFREMMKGKDSYSLYDVPSLIDKTLRALMRTHHPILGCKLLIWCDNNYNLTPDESTSRMMLMSIKNLSQEEYQQLSPVLLLILNRKPYRKAFPEQIEGLPRVSVIIDSIWFSWEVKCIMRFFASAHLSNLKSKTIPKVSLIIKECPLPVVNADDFPKGLLEAKPSLSDAQIRIQHALQRPFNLIPQSLDKNSNIIELDQKQLEAFVHWWRGNPLGQSRQLLQPPGPTTLSEPSLLTGENLQQQSTARVANVSSPWNADSRVNTPSSQRVTATPDQPLRSSQRVTAAPDQPLRSNQRVTAIPDQPLRRRLPASRVARDSAPYRESAPAGQGSWESEVVHPLSCNTPLNRRPPYSVPNRDWFEPHDEIRFAHPNQASFRSSNHGQFENSNQIHSSNSNYSHFSNSDQGRFANPYQSQFADPCQGQFADSYQGQFADSYQGQFADPYPGQFADSYQGQFANPDQDQFANQHHFQNPNRPQFPNPNQRSFPIPNQVPDQLQPLRPPSDLRETLQPRFNSNRSYDNQQVYRNQSRGGGRRTSHRPYPRGFSGGRGMYGNN